VIRWGAPRDGMPGGAGPANWWWLLSLLTALVVGAVSFLFLAARPPTSLVQARGLYGSEIGREERVFQWTSSRVRLPLSSPSPATLLRLELAAEPWAGRPTSVVTLATTAGPLGSFVVPASRRSYHLLVPGETAALLLQTNVSQPPDRPWHWVGVQIFSLEAHPLGPPWRAGLAALLLALASVPLLLAARWLIARGHAPLALITLLALALRTLWLDHSPPGAHHDELVSLVDAWYLLHTARDHHGNWLPLGAFEAFGDWISPLLTYLMLPAVAAAGAPAPLAGRLVTALIGTLAVPLIYALARDLELPRPAALGCALVTALAPWQVSLSRAAIPPALVFVSLTLCLWAGLRLVRGGGRGAAWGLALAAGIGLHAYPTLKPLMPALVGLVVALALLRHGWAAARGWLGPAALLALLWAPFVWVTLLNTDSNTRFNHLVISAENPLGWLASWLPNYGMYFGPDYYYRSGDSFADHGYLQDGVQLWAEAPLVLLGLGALFAAVGAELRAWVRHYRHRAPGRRPPTAVALLLLGALLLMPLPTSLTWQNPHAYRASSIAPIYTLLVGMGLALLWGWSGRIAALGWRRALRWGLGGALTLALLLQGGAWFQGYLERYPLRAGGAWLYQDGLLETMGYAAEQADEVAAVWFDRPSANNPHIYLLAALPAPVEDPAQQLRFADDPGVYYAVEAVGRYQFRPLGKLSFDLPTSDAILDRFGRPAYLIQRWQDDNGQPVLIVRPYP
jgi:hypothetical protein